LRKEQIFCGVGNTQFLFEDGEGKICKQNFVVENLSEKPATGGLREIQD
jgi:hypothetical protein